MSSIRIFLVLGLLAILTLIIFLSALHGYRTSMAEAQKLFDRTLADTTQLLASIDHYGEQTDHVVVETDKYVFQVWKDDQLQQQSANAPGKPIASFSAGFQDNNFSGYRWRTYTLFKQNTGRWFVMAERADIRYALAEKIILESVMPIVYSLPLGGLMIWFFVGRALSPLRQLAEQLGNKKISDLGPLQLDNQPNELTRVVSSTNDLLQRLEASFEREKRFTADAAHELRTPISALKVHLYNLSCGLPEDDNNIQQMESAVERMGYLVEQILQLHRTSPDQYMAKFHTINLHDIVQRVLIQEYPKCEQKKLNVALDADDCFVNADEFALEILVQNILANACKYTPVGGDIKVSVKCAADKVKLKIEDSGPGIPEDQYDRIFDRFYRLDGDRHKSQVIGCGLGLAIVKHVVDLHGAHISLGKSPGGDGLSFVVDFDVASPG